MVQEAADPVEKHSRSRIYGISIPDQALADNMFVIGRLQKNMGSNPSKHFVSLCILKIKTPKRVRRNSAIHFPDHFLGFSTPPFHFAYGKVGTPSMVV